MKNNNVVVEKSFKPTICSVLLYKNLKHEKDETVLSNHFLPTVTSIGANVKEAIRGQSKSDFISKLNFALNDASETEYWLELLYRADFLDSNQNKILISECREILNILDTFVKSSREKH